MAERDVKSNENTAISLNDLLKVIMSAEDCFSGREQDCRATVYIHEAYLYVPIS